MVLLAGSHDCGNGWDRRSSGYISRTCSVVMVRRIIYPLLSELRPLLLLLPDSQLFIVSVSWAQALK
jgi:hypothetical protein